MATLDVLRIPIPARLHRVSVIALPLLLLAASAPAYEPTGPPPLTSQVVDAETGQPLEGAVVLVYWTRCWPSPGGWAGCTFYDAEETVTGPDGRYRIRSRFTYTIPLITQVRFAELVIFKPGYGPFQWRLSGDTEVMALPPLKTREERLEKLVTSPGFVPAEYQKRLLEAIRRERAYLGLH